jgi:hypothetical protein
MGLCREREINKKRTDIICIELIDPNKCSNGGGPQTPFCNLTNNRELASMEVIDDDTVELGYQNLAQEPRFKI